MSRKIKINIEKELATYDSINLNEAKECLCSADATLKPVIEAVPDFNLQTHKVDNLFSLLVESIIYQQLTAKAAATIYGRLCQAFSNKVISPLDIIRAEDEELRIVGISRNKITALRDLSEKALEGKLPSEKELLKTKNEEIISQLTKIKGIGRWTVEMLLIFTLGRSDVVSCGDFSLRKGLAIISGKMPKIPTAKELEERAKIWSPYRSIASWYLWRAVDLYNRSYATS